MGKAINGFLIGDWAEVHCEAAHHTALACARGSYQLDLLRGVEALSGSTLRGAARSYGGRYRRSREALLARMTECGVPWSERRGAHGKRILVIGVAS